MTSAIQGLTVITLMLGATARLQAQAEAPSASVDSSAASSDSGSKHGAGHHHAGAKHEAGHKWLSFDAASNTVTFKLEAGRPRGTSRLNFNGHANGTATLIVPAKSNVVMHFVNLDSVPHSAAIIADREPMPARVDRAAIPNAATKDLTQGLPPNGTDVLRFTVPRSGSYRIVSGVPGQARSGMWIRLKVDSTAKAPAWLKSKHQLNAG